jgi:hypothetical protein
LVGVAVKVTEVPAHIVVAVGETDTEGVRTGLTVMLITLEVAVVVDKQLAFEVITTEMFEPCVIPVLV